MNYRLKLLESTLRIEQLMRLLVDKSDKCPYCRNMTAAVPEDPEPHQVRFHNEREAAVFLQRSEKTVYRYRKKGELPFSVDEYGSIRYAESDLEKLFERLHGFPKGGFSK